MSLSKRPPSKQRPDIRSRSRTRTKALPKPWERTPEQHRQQTPAPERPDVPVGNIHALALGKTSFPLYLLALGFSNYQSYLWSPLWLGIRSAVFKRAHRRCEDCGARATQVHHHVYTRENLAGDSLEGLFALCDGCHEARHHRPPT